MGGNSENLTLLKIIKHRYQGKKRTMITVPTDLEKEIIRLAHVIAKSQRNEDHLQSYEVLLDKCIAEVQEIKREQQYSVEWWSEAADVIYYLIQMKWQFVPDEDSRLSQPKDLMFSIHYNAVFLFRKLILDDLGCDDVHVIVNTMVECCMLKYTARARDGKNKITENAALEGLLKMLSHVHNTNFIK